MLGKQPLLEVEDSKPHQSIHLLLFAIWIITTGKKKRSKLVCSSHHQNETYLVKSQQTEQNNAQDILTPNEQDKGMFQECPAAKIKTKKKRRSRRRKTKNNPNRLSDSVGQRNCEERQQSRGRCLKGLGKSFPSDLAAGIHWNSLWSYRIWYSGRAFVKPPPQPDVASPNGNTRLRAYKKNLFLIIIRK